MSDLPLADLRAALDATLVGHAEAKTGLLLALLAREHAYLEGPPGCGKSALAEAVAGAAGARGAALRFHRDIRESDLLGAALLRRERRGSEERLWREVEPGPLLRAEVLCLDDLPRAPGEALGPLLRILSERRALGRALPLETAVATGVPPALEAYADPLEPTQLDRFAVQIRMRGLLWQRNWRAAGDLLAGGAMSEAAGGISAGQRRALQARAAGLPIDPAAREALVILVERLARAAGEEGVALISDRAFGCAAPRLMRAHALLRGAARVEPIDLRAVRYMVGCRLPAAAQPLVEKLIEQVIERAPVPVSLAVAPRAGEWTGQGGEADARTLYREPPERVDEPIESTALPPRAPAADAAEVEALLRALGGRIDRGRVERRDDPGGQPRRYRRLERLDEVFDADPVEVALYADGCLPGAPHAYRRERRNAGGLVALLRDVSASMEGRLSRWAGEVVAGLVRVGARRRMRLGYVEFNHRAERYSAAGHFFHRRYRKLLALAAARRAEGRTSYEAPLRLALAEFRHRAGRNRHVVLLTDGVPVSGDPTVARERALACRLGVRVHTIFLGLGECPAVLDAISRETGGARFLARPGADGRLRLRARGAA